ncbi:GNAT family N-acetyltransferase [Candidatus Gracilibacteria bacterium]|nr:GNAT family N-acetyltransferase [Candidatus Gracilibacteria bacterium]
MERIEVLSSKNISLVVPEKQDIKLWYQGVNNIETQKYLGSMFGQVISLEAEEDYFNKLKNDQSIRQFCIYVKPKSKIIGNISLMEIDFQNRKANFGIAIFDEKSRGKGYGTESIKLILEYAFEVLGLNKINLGFIEFNERARAVYEKIGFKYAGTLKQDFYQGGKYYDHILMEIFFDNFKK